MKSTGKIEEGNINDWEFMRERGEKKEILVLKNNINIDWYVTDKLNM